MGDDECGGAEARKEEGGKAVLHRAASEEAQAHGAGREAFRRRGWSDQMAAPARHRFLLIVG